MDGAAAYARQNAIQCGVIQTEIQRLVDEAEQCRAEAVRAATEANNLLAQYQAQQQQAQQQAQGPHNKKT